MISCEYPRTSVVCVAGNADISKLSGRYSLSWLRFDDHRHALIRYSSTALIRLSSSLFFLSNSAREARSVLTAM